MPIPTTCFVDVVLMPIPVWIYLLLVPALFALSHHQRRKRFSPSALLIRSIPRKTWQRTTVLVIYYALLLANILMQTLDIVRLALTDLGIGLLPFIYVGLLLALGLHATNGCWERIENGYWVSANVFLWVGLMAFSAVKTVGLRYMENKGLDRIPSKYPTSDQVLDLAVSSGVYLVLAGLEVGLAFWRRRRIVGGRRSEDRESEDLQSWEK